MPDETIVCPSCHRKLRVPDQQLGQVVQCPLCAVVFVAPLRLAPPVGPEAEIPFVLPAPDAAPRPAQQPKVEPAGESLLEEDGEEERPLTEAEAAEQQRILEIHRKLVTPGVGLLVCSLLSIFILLRSAIDTYYAGPAGLVRQQEEAFEKWPMLKAWSMPLQGEEVQAFGFGFTLVVLSLSLLLNLGVAIGAVQMLRLRMYWLAIAGSVLAICNLFGGCCLLSLPLGIWSLRVLLQTEVRNAFE